MLKKSKQKEREALWSWPVFVRIDYPTAWRLGLKMVRSRWVLTKKNKKEIKARFVACELAFGKRLDCWAGAPMSITHRLLLCLATLLDFEATVGDAKSAFKFRAFCVAVDIDFAKPLVLSTFARSTIALESPPLVPQYVGL